MKRALFGFFIVFLLFGCGSGGSKTSATPSPKRDSSAPLMGKVITIPDLLQVHYNRSIDCPLAYVDGMVRFTPNALVLNSTRLTYDSGEIQQMAAYVNGVEHHFLYDDPGSVQVPNTMQLVPGSLTADIKQWSLERRQDQGCNGTIEITNITKAPIQLSGISAQLNTAPHQNSYSYRLINVCSLPIEDKPTQCPPHLRGGGIEYNYDFHLAMANANMVFEGQRQEDPQGPGTTIRPGDVLTADLNFTSSKTSKSPDNLVYDILPILKIDVSGEQRTITLPQLRSTVSFVDASQLACYSLQGNRFVQLQPIAKQNDHVWCI